MNMKKTLLVILTGITLASPVAGAATCLREKMKTLSRHSELAKAFAYALNQWPALTYYADDGWAEADNNIAENALRMVSLGRKNYVDRPTQRGGSPDCSRTRCRGAR